MKLLSHVNDNVANDMKADEEVYWLKDLPSIPYGSTFPGHCTVSSRTSIKGSRDMKLSFFFCLQ